MNKFLELLEQHCQWIAIGIGGLFLAWVLYAYVLINPAAVEDPRGGEALVPGEVDLTVKKETADPLDRQINDTRQIQTPANAGVIVRKPWEDQFTARDRAPTALPSYAFNSQSANIKIVVQDPTTEDRLKITELPAPTPGLVLDLKSGRANVAPPAPAPAAGGNAPVAAPAIAKDITYVRGHYSINLARLADSFRSCKIPAQATTSIIAVEIYRQTLEADGTWSKPETIKLIDNGVKIMPPPPAGANRQQVGLFRGWVESAQGQADLIRPPFYSVAAGEGPWDPPMKLEIVDPEVERTRRMEAARAAAIERAKAKAASTPRPQPTEPREPREPRGRTGRTGRGGENPQVNDTDRASSYAELAGLELAQVTPPPRPPGMFDVPPEMMDPNNPANVNPAAPGAPGEVVPAGGLPPASFNPTQPGVPPEIVGWFFDENVQEGRTYRYNVRYAIRNPVYESNLVANPKLAEQFVIWSQLDDNNWSAPVKIEPGAFFFLAQGNWGGNNVPQQVVVEVFKWAAGKWQRDVFRVSPGDRVGSDTKFRTDSVLVDIRYDERLEKAYVLFLEPDGRLSEQNPISARNSPLRAALINAANPPGTDPNAPGGVGGVGVGGVGGAPTPVAGR